MCLGKITALAFRYRVYAMFILWVLYSAVLILIISHNNRVGEIIVDDHKPCECHQQENQESPKQPATETNTIITKPGTATTATTVTTTVTDNQPPHFICSPNVEKTYAPGATIPKIVHIAVKDKNSAHDVVSPWKSLNPDFQVILYDDADMETLVKTVYPEFLNLYHSVYLLVERTDIWRYLIMHHRGGIYADADWTPRKPFHEWVDLIEGKKVTDIPKVMLGFENQYEGEYKGVPVLQWGFAAVQHHPMFYQIVEHIQNRFIEELLSGVYYGDAIRRTGPGPFVRGVLRYLQRSGAKIGDMSKHHTFRHKEVLIAAMRFWETGGELASHGFSGTWKVGENAQWQNQTRERFLAMRERYWNGTALPL